MFESALLCLALGLYHEARSEPLVGQLSVGFVVMNRVDDSRYPDSICEVVKQGRTHPNNPNVMLRHQCQFSFFCDGLNDTPKNLPAWNHSIILASQILGGQYKNTSEGATHYHANYVSPTWADESKMIAQVGTHIFYRLE
jgi:N-acetylmuramoyl-L-alanine amidase|tara:strand:- start:1423 stop:1842 length:420 start_codon:yes stop_codon:yes gene_type:complete